MNRLNQILAVVLAVQVVLGVVVFWPRPAAGNAAGPLVANLQAADVTALTIADSEGKQVELAKNGDNWILPNAGDFPVDSTKVTPVLDKLAGLKTNRLVTQTDASHERLQVADDAFSRRVEVKLKDGSSHKIYLGSSAGANTIHVRADDQPEVYLTSDLSTWEVGAEPSGWIDTLYYTVPQTATVALTLKNGNGTFEFQKDGDKWTMQGLAAGETFSENNFSTLLGQATSMRMTAPLGKEAQPDFGLAEPQAVVTLKTQDGGQEKTYTLQIGAKNEADNTYTVKWSDSPYYVRVADFTATAFLEKTRDNFLQAPPTPEATTEPAAPAQ